MAERKNMWKAVQIYHEILNTKKIRISGENVVFMIYSYNLNIHFKSCSYILYVFGFIDANINIFVSHANPLIQSVQKNEYEHLKQIHILRNNHNIFKLISYNL